MTGLGAQMGMFKHGIGTPHPFRFLTFEGKSASELKNALEQLKVKGLSFKIMETEDSGGKKIKGVYIIIKDWNVWQPTELAFAMMQLTASWQSPSPFSNAKKSEVNLFNKHVGSTAWWNHLEKSGNSVDPSPFLRRWDKEADSFRKQTESFLMY